MGILAQVLNKQASAEGEIGYFGLGSWWMSAFSKSERDYIEEAFKPKGVPAGARPLTRDRGHLSVSSAAGLLSGLAGSLGKRLEDRQLALRILAKAEERGQAEDDVMGLYFTYQEMIRLHFRWIDKVADALDSTFVACHKQIALAPTVATLLRKRYPLKSLPVHLGYQQAASLLEKKGNYSRAIAVCKQAQAEGWSGNWTWRIGRMAKKMSHTPRGISSAGMTQIWR